MKELWLDTWSHEPFHCPEVKLRNPGVSIAIDRIPEPLAQVTATVLTLVTTEFAMV